MNERPRNNGEYPQLSLIEIESLIARAKVEVRQMTDVDYADIQPQELPQPHVYIIEVNPDDIQEYKDEQGMYVEEVIKAFLEYNDARVLYENGPILPAKLAITIKSHIYNEQDPSLVYTKDATYTLMLEPQAQWEVVESYSEDDRALNADLANHERAASNDPRPLTHEELSLLRLFL